MLEMIKIIALVAAVLVLAKFLDEYLVGRMKERRERKGRREKEK